jgi:hypothetical protein
MRRRRRCETEIEKMPEQIAVDEFFELSEHVERKRSAYGSACSLDRAGRYAAADDVLRCAHVPQEEIEQRRRHIEWRLEKGLSAL